MESLIVSKKRQETVSTYKVYNREFDNYFEAEKYLNKIKFECLFKRYRDKGFVDIKTEEEYNNYHTSYGFVKPQKFPVLIIFDKLPLERWVNKNGNFVRDAIFLYEEDIKEMLDKEYGQG